MAIIIDQTSLELAQKAKWNQTIQEKIDEVEKKSHRCVLEYLTSDLDLSKKNQAKTYMEKYEKEKIELRKQFK